MTDASTIKSQVDLREIIEKDLGTPKHRSGQYNAYHCPFHNERKGQSFAVYGDHWICYGKCNESGDVFEWLKRRHDMAFMDAVRYLGGDTGVQRRAPAPAAPPVELPATPPPAEWQRHAKQVVKFAQEILWSDEGALALDYLIEQRGLFPSWIKAARLGYVPARDEVEQTYGRVAFKDWLKPDGKPYRVPCGIVIPHIADHQLWAVRVRRMTPAMLPAPGDKYLGIAGGSKSLFWADEIFPGDPVVITEGEFDTLVLEQCAFNRVCAVALASASYAHLNMRFLTKLGSAPKIFARVDGDAAGAAAIEKLRKSIPSVQPLQVPTGKDINEFYMLHGLYAVREWIVEATR